MTQGEEDVCRPDSLLAHHSIRLRGPWTYRPLTRSVLSVDGRVVDVEENLPPQGTMRIPGDWGGTLGAAFRGRVLFNRRFGKPGNLDPDERIHLVIERIDALGSVSLNGHELGAIKPASENSRFPVTHLLQPRNELAIIVELPSTAPDSPPLPRLGREALAGGIVGEVRLEIHR